MERTRRRSSAVDRWHSLEIIDDQGRYHVPDPEILALAKEIEQQFIARAPRVPGVTHVGKKALPKFYAAARICKTEKLTAVQFVVRQLERMALTGSFWPTAIASNYESKPAARTELTLGHYRSQLEIYEQRRTLYDPALLLEEEGLTFTPLFRFAMAVELGHLTLVNKLRLAAAEEYLANPVCEKLFSYLKGALNG